MRLLLLGGTWFLGRTLAELAVEAGWEVTCFNRGKTGRDVPGTHSIRGDRTSQADLDRLAAGGPWDAVVDTSVYEPPDALAMATALKDTVGTYVLTSTVSAYRDWPAQPVSEISALWPSRPDARESDSDLAAIPEPHAYGTLKAGCEQAVREVFADRSLILRPGVVLGPHEYVGRLSALLRRAERGGPMLAAGDPTQPIQPLDVRDLANFLIRLLRAENLGTFNVTAPPGHSTYGSLLEACTRATGGGASLVWADSLWLQEQGVRQWTEMPLWRTPAGTWAVDSTRAVEAGLTCRPLPETVEDTWQSLHQEPLVAHTRQGEHGMQPEREAQLLRLWYNQEPSSI
ncbi:NAD-dependent epimerase/dehydratase family protein [Kineosporia sp. NBRC 101731]|uniref:NAD-dependent epimerase/dehydratase family protein n=1 Tax=Kineosporia sp. NBRC 101731 TaxID=3032199 RepID=UPI0024A484F3|nr:NAD-dependent epimerase/dehydratase family protein [Kineosporia sp. NBRC 101731]GLY33458.1 reductase [Kineosporia sp. NBRC 101731]